VIVVVLFHARVSGFPGGFIGVDAFFVISGFLITRLLVREHESSGTIQLAAFWARRFRRILPTLFITLVITMIVGTLILPPWERTDLFESARAAAISLGNFHFWNADGGYFASTTAEQPLLNIWSLGVEEQFYLVWPIGVLLALRWGGRRSLAIWVASIVLASFVLSFVLTSRSPAAAFYLPQARIWEIAAGAAVALFAPTPPRVSPRISASIGWIGILGIIGSALFVDADKNFPSPLALIPVIATAVLIGFTSSETPLGRALSNPVLASIGRWSYGWYLFHWPALVLCRSVLGRHSVGWELAVCVGTLVLAALNHRFVEKRFIHKSALSRRPSNFILFVGITFSIFVTGIASWGAMVYRANDEVAASDILSMITSSTSPPSTEDVVTSESNPGTVTPTKEIDWTSDQGLKILTQSRRQMVWPCVNFSFNLPFDNECSIIKGEKSIVAIGDSHVGSAALALGQVASDSVLGLRLTGQAMCPIADVDTFINDFAYVRCREWATKVIENILANRESVAAVVWLVRSDYYFPGDSISKGINIDEATIGASGEKSSVELAGNVWRDGIRAFLSQLNEAGIPIVLMHNWPEFPQWPSDCLSKQKIKDCAISRTAYFNYRRASFTAEEAAVEGLDHLVTVDPSNSLCFAELCPMAQASKILYRDDNHLTPEGSLRLVPLLGAAIKAAIAK
jgi:peptidoglycan/LPS O-acetylase OafA/YrhL